MEQRVCRRFCCLSHHATTNIQLSPGKKSFEQINWSRNLSSLRVCRTRPSSAVFAERFFLPRDTTQIADYAGRRARVRQHSRFVSRRRQTWQLRTNCIRTLIALIEGHWTLAWPGGSHEARPRQENVPGRCHLPLAVMDNDVSRTTRQLVNNHYSGEREKRKKKREGERQIDR